MARKSPTFCPLGRPRRSCVLSDRLLSTVQALIRQTLSYKFKLPWGSSAQADDYSGESPLGYRIARLSAIQMALVAIRDRHLLPIADNLTPRYLLRVVRKTLASLSDLRFFRRSVELFRFLLGLKHNQAKRIWTARFIATRCTERIWSRALNGSRSEPLCITGS